VIATAKSDYGYLIGMVTAIDKLGTSDHDTENTTDDVHVDFTSFEYPSERKADIEADFSALYGVPMVFDDIALDDVIMAPKMLIGISHLSQEERAFMGNLQVNCEAFCNCFPGAVVPRNEKHGALMERAEDNLEEYHDSLMCFGQRELIEMAEKINAMSEAYSFICFNDFSDDELDFLLQFQRPLEIIADGWVECNLDIGNQMGYAFEAVMQRKKDWLGGCPLMDDSIAPIGASSVQEKAEMSAGADTARVMSEQEFRDAMTALLPDMAPEILQDFTDSANDLDAREVHPKSEYFRDTVIEFALVSRHYRPEVTQQLLEVCKTFTLDPHEIRGAASLLRDGAKPSKIEEMAYEGLCDRNGKEDAEFEQAVEAFENGTFEYLKKSAQPQSDKKTSIGGYPLMDAAPEEYLPRRFMNVDIQDFFDVTSQKAVAQNPAG
jgi:hypothetical protein